VHDDLLEARVHEHVELDLDDRQQAVHGHSDRGSDDACLGQRGVHDPLGAELV
jgi:hypothetical protein